MKTQPALYFYVIVYFCFNILNYAASSGWPLTSPLGAVSLMG